MKAKIILVETEYSGNLGYSARAIKNFGQKDLLLVKPKASHLSGEAKSRAMHAIEVLRKAKKLSSLKQARKEVDFLVGTTSKTVKGGKIFRSALPLKEFAERFRESGKVFGLVFGCEKNGLTNEQARECDFLVSIPTSRSYRAMNLSHAVAVVLYELFGKNQAKGFTEMNSNQRRLLEKELSRILEESRGIRNKANVLLSIKALLAKSIISKKEANALISLFKRKKRKNTNK